ncbi:MAG TPA: lanthionine synthetase LanC family protein [Thermoanaerobaculia bacterium]|nr:lanthionine synthetase LanC family protein [Thermoanaerobaculia bacterium]
MKRASAVLLTLLIVAVPVFAKRRAIATNPRAYLSSPYLDAAKQTASWLASLERRGTNGSSWPSSDRSQSASPGLGSGAAGIGAFHLRLYQASGETRYLETARNAAAFVAHEYRNGREGGYDWLSGAVGGGELFVLMYRETGEARYLDDAKMTGDLLLRMARRDATGTHWEFTGNPNVFTGIVHGSAGAGVFFLHLAGISGESRYLDIARDTYKWMREHTIAIGSDGIGWKRLTKDAAAYHGFCGGSSGILHFIDELLRATNDPAYRADLVATANGLANAAVPIGDEAAWRYYSSDRNSFPVIYCHGTSCASAALAQAFATTGEARYADLVRAAAKHLGAISQTVKGDGPVWQHIEQWEQIETGFQTGAASVGHTFLRLHAALGEPDYLARATGVGDYLLRAADRPAAGQIRWINYQQIAPNNTSATAAYETGWYAGASGIGLFLIDLHERTIGRAPLERFSIIHP